jgi:UPF0755 protein
LRRLIVTAGLMLVAGVGTGYGALWLVSAPGPLTQGRDVVVPRGKLSAVADVLAQSGVIRSRIVFRGAAMATWADGPVHAGELAFPAGASVVTVLDVLRNGRPVQHRVTIPEGLSAAQMSRILAGADALAGELEVPPEGAVLPDTYDFELGTTSRAIVSRGRSAMARVLASAWAARAPGLPLHSAREALVLASMVEREAKLPAERPMIARVFLNRLDAHMRLQSDPTTVYGASGGLGVLPRGISRDDLEHDDAYNTYVVEGLPAGPICSPGVASLQAVLHPSSGAALYFVADGTGGHVFATSLTAHNANVSTQRTRRQK